MGLHERALVSLTVSLRDLLRAGQSVDIGGETSFMLGDYVESMTSSGFPGIMGAPPRLRRGLLDTYLTRVIDRDLPDQGYDVRRREVLRRWMAAYAAASSTTIAYRDHLTRLGLLDPVPGWIPANNPIRRLQRAPKHHLADPALAARLLNLSSGSLPGPSGEHMMGPLFESLVTLTVRVLAQAEEATVSPLRLRGGEREVDLIVQGSDGQVLGIEVKLAADVHDSDVRHLPWLREQIPERIADLVVVTTGRTAYRRADGVAVVPLALLGL